VDIRNNFSDKLWQSHIYLAVNLDIIVLS